MPESPNRNISIAVILVLVLLLVGGIAVVSKSRQTRRALSLPQSVQEQQQRRMIALPPGASQFMTPPHEYRGACESCHPVADASNPNAFAAQTAPGQLPAVAAGGVTLNPDFGSWGPARGNGALVALHAPDPALGAPDADPGAVGAAGGGAAALGAGGAGVQDILTPAQQKASTKMLIEGHWLGMEIMDLTPALRRIYRVPPEVNGLIIDEITLESAESGILAGDVITNIEGTPTATLRDLVTATTRVAEKQQARVTVYRRGGMKTFTIVAQNTPTVGFAAVEGAQPIKPGALSPHADRGRACTECHVMMSSGGQLPVDAGDITVPPPAISAGAQAPHPFRGTCNSCHQILK